MPNIGKEQYIKRHDRTCGQLHFNTCREVGLQLDNEHVPKLVETSREGKVAMLWNQQVQTDRTISNNKQDTVIRVNEKGA
jgi:hypothetical protein